MKSERRSDLATDPALLRLVAGVNGVVLGKPAVVRQAVVTLLAGGHLLVEDVPGVGKTTLGRALARAMGGTFRRVQFTSDLLPADVLGVNVFDSAAQVFRFRPGPIFAHVLLADEINRTTPRTQSALLQAMEEQQVTLDGETHPLPDPFFVIATQNPAEHHGTYPLPESQLDRFLMRVSMVSSPEALARARRQVRAVRMSESLADYVLRIVEATRAHPDLSLGASPRAGAALGRAARAAALLDGRDYAIPDDVKALVEPVLAHRLLARDPGPGPSADRDVARAALAEVLLRVPVPL
jgi:MoxR-like ATPase